MAKATSKLRKTATTKNEEVENQVDVKDEEETVTEETPEIKVIDKAVETASKVEVKAETGKSKAEAMVRVVPNRDIRTFIGDQWYNLQAGKTYSVPKTVKDILNLAGKLTVL